MSIRVSSTLDCSVLGWHCWQLQHCCHIQDFVNNQKIIISNKIFGWLQNVVSGNNSANFENTAVWRRTNSNTRHKPEHTSLKKCTNWAKLIHFSLVLREREEKKQTNMSHLWDLLYCSFPVSFLTVETFPIVLHTGHFLSNHVFVMS